MGLTLSFCHTPSLALLQLALAPGSAVHLLIDRIATAGPLKPCRQSIVIVGSGKSTTDHFINGMVEDKSPAGASFSEHLSNVHRQIQMKFQK
jgi:hypothetical protein